MRKSSAWTLLLAGVSIWVISRVSAVSTRPMYRGTQQRGESTHHVLFGSCSWCKHLCWSSLLKMLRRHSTRHLCWSSFLRMCVGVRCALALPPCPTLAQAM
eukprot:4589440-Amphidinium_carterae.1